MKTLHISNYRVNLLQATKALLDIQKAKIQGSKKYFQFEKNTQTKLNFVKKNSLAPILYRVATVQNEKSFLKNPPLIVFTPLKLFHSVHG